MCGNPRIGNRHLGVLLFAMVLGGTPGGAQRGPEDYNRADLVCIGRVDAQTGLRIPRVDTFDLLIYTTFTVTRVLKGEASMAGRQVVVKWYGRTRGIPIGPYLRNTGAYYVAALRERGAEFAPVFEAGGYEVTSRTVVLPAEAPLNEKINLILLATIRDCRDDNIAVSLALSGLIIEGATADSPYYDLLEEYISLEDNPSLLARSQALYARLRLGDVTALPAAMDHATSEPWLSARLPQVLQTFGDDAVTTLCLIADGKILPKRKMQAVEALRRMAPPTALPVLIRALDDPNREVRYHAYAAIEKIRGKRFTTTFAEFNGRTIDPHGVHVQRSNDPPPDDTHSNMLINEMKQWWETEGKRQYDYVLKDQD